MAISDEVRSAPKYKPVKNKEKKGFKKTFIPLKGDTVSEIVGKIIVFVSIIALIICAVVLGIYFYHLYEAKSNNVNINIIYQKASNNRAEADDNSTPLETPSDTPEEKKPLVLLPAAEEMLKINPDYAGFIEIPGVVNEAIVQTDSNDYYLNHNFYDQKRSCGTVFVDYRCTLNDYEQSDHITLYGHNQKDGTMFGQLDFYKWDYKYWLKNPFIYLDTKYEESTYVIIASFITNVNPEDDNGYVFDYHNYINFKDEDNRTFQSFYDAIMLKTHFYTGIDVNEDDKFLTLSTCSYEWEPARHVVIARKLRDGETTENIDTTNFSVNSNPKWPAIYYKYNGGSYVEQ